MKKLFLFLGLMIFLISLFIPNLVLGSWYNESWDYRQPDYIYSTAGNLTNYQIKIELNSSNFNYSNANTTGQDIRFTNSSDDEIDYWIENWNTSGSSYIWVEVPFLENATNTTLYMYYGNSEAGSASNFDNTFLFGDDFSGDALNTDKWNTQILGGTVTVTGGALELDPGAGNNNYAGVTTKTFTFTNNAVIEMKRKTSGTHYLYSSVGSGDFYHDGTNNYLKSGYFLEAYRTDLTCIAEIDASGGKVDGTWVDIGNWSTYKVHKFIISDEASNNLRWYIDDNLETQETNTTWLSNAKNISLVQSQYSGRGGTYSTDWVRTRKYASPEPTYTLGSEETEDSTPPTTTPTAVKDDETDYTFDTWTNSTYVSVTLSCDDGSGAGCDVTQYCLDTNNTCTPNNTYSSEVQITTEGVSYIRFRSNDTVGNMEDTKNQTIKIDTTKPTFSDYKRNPDPPNEDQNVQLNVTITETNLDIVTLEWSGTANYTITTNSSNEYYYTINKGNYTAHDSVTYYWFANDTVGNSNKSAQQSFTVANQIPSVTAPTINDSTPYTDDIISCDNGTFSDNDAEDTEGGREFKWFNNSAELSGQTSQTLDLSVAGLNKDDIIKCSIRVNDSYDWSNWVNSTNNATIQNSAPYVILNEPSNGATGISLNPTLNVTYYDLDGDTGNVSFWDNSTGLQINTTQINIPNGSSATVIWDSLNYTTTYYWYANATDGVYTTQSDIWSFTTRSEFVLNLNKRIILYPIREIVYP